jgi:uncharacterized membrane protein YjgN (DUF898 family)
MTSSTVIVIGASAAVAPALSGFLGVALMIGWPFAYAAYKAIEWRWWASGVRFGEVRFESTLRAGALVPLYWMVIAWSFFIFLFLMAWFGGVGYLAWLSAGPGKASPEAFAVGIQQVPILVAMAAGYLIAMLAFTTAVRIYLRRDVWARVVASTTVHNLEAAANVTARGDAAGALGEGFADNLDIGGI